MQKPVFQNDYYYHIVNRGVDKRDVFLDEKDFLRFLWSLRIFNSVDAIGSIYEKYHLCIQGGVGHPKGCPTPQRKKLVEICCYVLLNNHFHFILKPLEENGIPMFMKKISGGYTNYFNRKYSRSGSLFQGKYKAFEIDDTDLLLEKSLYINGNAEIHGLAKCDKWPWSSCKDYLGMRRGTLADKKVILNDIGVKNYKKLLIDYISEKKELKNELKDMDFE